MIMRLTSLRFTKDDICPLSKLRIFQKQHMPCYKFDERVSKLRLFRHRKMNERVIQKVKKNNTQYLALLGRLQSLHIR